MKFEVEKKFWLTQIEPMIERLSSQGICVAQPVDQVDRYFAHPAKDFMQTDEALRLRAAGDQNFITYKGTRIDSTTKTRRELELPLPDGEFRQEFEQLLLLLGFKPMMTIHKLRRKAEIDWQGYPIEVSIDEIDQLGSFIEIETTSDLEHLDLAKQALESLAAQLALDRPERRSYLELMLHHLGPQRLAT